MWFTYATLGKTDLSFTIDLCAWSLPLHISWLYITKKEMPELAKNIFVFDLKILCISLKLEYCW